MFQLICEAFMSAQPSTNKEEGVSPKMVANGHCVHWTLWNPGLGVNKTYCGWRQGHSSLSCNGAICCVPNTVLPILRRAGP